MDLVLSRTFLARAEQRLGDSATARRLIGEARAICKTKALSPAVTLLVERIANEIGPGEAPVMPRRPPIATRGAQPRATEHSPQ